MNSNKIEEILTSKSFFENTNNTNRQQLIKIANEVGPRMRVIHANTIEEQGRLPHFEENLTIDSIEAINLYKAPYVELFMFSHQWLRPHIDATKAHPDTADHKKARALIEFSKWRKKWVEEHHNFTPQIFYWIDYCCFDQKTMAESFIMLPLWVACCERFLCYQTPDYANRAWCRVEVLLSHIFSFADHHTIIDESFKCRWPYTGKATFTILKNPTEALVTNPQDYSKVQSLSSIAIKLAVPVLAKKNKHATPVIFEKTKIKSFKL